MDSLPFDPNNVEALRRRIAELEANQRAAVGATSQADGVAEDQHSGSVRSGFLDATIATEGGASIQGPVEAGGHFIGRDFIQYVTKIFQDGDDTDDAMSVIAHYLHAMASDLAGLKLGEIDLSAAQTQRHPLQLADVYVPLDTQLELPEKVKLVDWLRRHEQPPSSTLKETQYKSKSRPVSALEALAAHRQLTILGRPGSGKSTFGASVLLTLAQVWQGHPDELAKLSEYWTHGALLPIRVILRRFADQLPTGDGAVRAGDLWAFIGHDLNASGYGLSVDTMKYVERLARSRGAMILLDGLDECGNSVKRERVLTAVQEFMRTAGPKCRVLLTARPYAWPSGPDPDQGVYALVDLRDSQIEQFIRAWHAALVARKWLAPGAAAHKMDELLRARQRPDLLPLARNPLLLTLMATLHANRGRLPDDRADLYNESVDLLMLRWNRQIGADKALLDALDIPGLKLSDLREAVEELAFRMHEDSVEDREEARAPGKEVEGTAEIGEDWLVRAFRPLLNNSRDKAAVVVDYIEKRAGLLVGQGEKRGELQFAFPHRTFQEFLAACHLAAKADFPAQCAHLARAAPAHWQVVLPLAARLAKAERGASAADELIGGLSVTEFGVQRQPQAADWERALMAGTLLQEIGLNAVSKSERTHSIAVRVTNWLAASLPVHPYDGGMPTAQRAQAEDVVGALGDPRFDPERLHLPTDDMLGFVRIAADPQFRIGTSTADVRRVAAIIEAKVPDEEINDASTPTHEFYIARYPVTVAQFKAFVDSTGFKFDATLLRAPDNHPVSVVTWYEAHAYCTWLQKMFIASPLFQHMEVARLIREDGWNVALPSELEWEKAARGELSSAVFPWGDVADLDRANHRDARINGSSALGCFPANSFGLYDMIGNVWEWTGSRFRKYPYHIYDGREDPPTPRREEMIARGGLFDGHVRARCALRNWLLPDFSDFGVGFRLSLRFSPAEQL